MEDNDRMIRLFGYEWDNRRHSILWQEPKYLTLPMLHFSEYSYPFPAYAP